MPLPGYSAQRSTLDLPQVPTINLKTVFPNATLGTSVISNDGVTVLDNADVVNASITSGQVTGALGFTPENAAHRDAASGYAALTSQSRIDKGAKTTDDLIVDLSTKGLVLKDTQGPAHYWRVTINNVGPALVLTDLGTTAP